MTIGTSEKALIKIGVITPTYNRPDLLLRLHNSLVNTGAGVDWIHYVVDDGSQESYEEVSRECSATSGRLSFNYIDNSGPLVARNHAIDLALAAGCTHLCFVDDDDFVINDGLSAIQKRLDQYPGEAWLVFPSKKNLAQPDQWPDKPTVMTWFQDVVVDGGLGSDNLVVVSASLIGHTRFSARGRNQREWTLFLDLSEKCDRVMVMPELIRHVDYQVGGLTHEAKLKKKLSPDQIFNNVERAFRYWRRKPFASGLIYNLLKQVISTPIKLSVFYMNKN